MPPPAALAFFPLALADLRFGQHQLAEPAWLLALLILPLLAWGRRRRSVSVNLIPFAAAWAAPRPPASRRWPLWCAGLAAVLLVVALARPQRIDDRRIIRGEGYDLILALDLSTSMYAEDSVIDGRRVNRLEALKPILEAFIRQRPSDRIGFVAFAGRAYTLAPLTHDHGWLARQIARLRIGLIEDGTAIGDGLGLALTRLARARADAGSDAPRAGSFVILLTDGANNRGQLAPAQAAALAKSQGVPVYTIGVGRDGLVPFPVIDESGRRVGTRNVPSDLDTAALRELAQTTGGKFFRADDPAAATEAFAAIDRAQKITFDQTTRILATELFAWPASAGGLLLLCALPALLRRRP
ncbi:MAG: VWA domain-containing protein [Opitutaceae bacterium]|jgi:Ca-activated chloride channel family protein|nr:VWA domain-containing protein [Opitutaceae bacterium]